MTRLQEGSTWYEVWQDRDGLIWSDIVRADANGGCGNTNCLPSSMQDEVYFNWCVASGANGMSGNSFASKDPNGYCDNATYQKQGPSGTDLPVSLCYESTGNLWTPSWVARSKGGASLAAEGIWYLPTAEDHILARKHGVRRVLPDFGLLIYPCPWSASVRADLTSHAWYFDGTSGTHVTYDARNYFSGNTVRCVRLP